LGDRSKALRQEFNVRSIRTLQFINFNPKLTYIGRLERICHLDEILEDPLNYPFSREFCLSTLHKLPLEITAGITFAAFAIPEVMGYTKIAGMPLVTGIYTILLPMMAFAIFGSSRHLAVGADSATAAIIASGLVAIAIPESLNYVAYAGMIALLAATLLLLGGLLKLGFLADFLSHTILIGFLTVSAYRSQSQNLVRYLGFPIIYMEHLCRSYLYSNICI